MSVAAMARSLCLFVTLLYLLCIPAFCVTFTTDTLIGSADTTYDGADIIVHGCTLTVDGSHTFNSLTIERSESNAPGIVTHSVGAYNGSTKGCTIHVTTDVTIQGADGDLVASRIDVSAKGSGPEQGSGAGSHGTIFGPGGGHYGAGGDVFNTTGGHAYPSPSDFGGGGGGGGTSPGAYGGGNVSITVDGTLTVDGEIRANGGDGMVDGGAGAGGSVTINGNTMTGSGRISADGGTATNSYCGGGGGGSVSITCTSYSFAGTTTAYGGYGNMIGGAGVVMLNVSSPSLHTMTIDNGGRSGATTYFYGGLYDITISDGAIVSGSGYSNNFHIAAGGVLTQEGCAASISVHGDAVIDAGGSVNVNGKGYPSEQGPGAGHRVYPNPAGGNSYGTGGGHGGEGGYVAMTRGGLVNDQVNSPTYPGSGGGNGSYYTTTVAGGYGGGCIELLVTGNLTINGSVSADGSDGAYTAGGGAGGTVRLSCQGTLSGTGTISADGGAAMTGAGSGGGGRVLVVYGTNNFGGPITACGGVGGINGGPGTLRLCKYGVSLGTIVIDNGGFSGVVTRIGGFMDALTISGGAMVSLDTGSCAALHVCSGGTLLQLNTSTLNANGDITIDAGGAVSADGRWYTRTSGSGFGANGSAGGGGGGYGGNGGYGWGGGTATVAGGTAFGTFVYGGGGPYFGGNGGYAVSGSTNPGGQGGGPIYITTTGRLTNNGAITANGSDGTGAGGGGAGGCIYLQAPSIAGSGTIAANGGNGLVTCAGGGAGGRITLASSNNTFAGAITAYGGTGYQTGGAGSVCSMVPGGYAVRIDNGGRSGALTPLGFPPNNVDLTVSGRAVAFPAQTANLRSLRLATGGKISSDHSPGTFGLVVSQDAIIDAGCAVTVSGLGRGSATGSGAGGSGAYGAGGGYGGKGGDSTSGAVGGSTYGDGEQPRDYGSGGGVGGTSAGGASGGSVTFTVGGTLTLDGSVVSDGLNGSYTSGGGSGGSVFMGVRSIVGSGTISANGGSAASLNAGGGGGGRVAVYYTDSTGLPTSHVTANGGTGANSGDNGSVVYTKLAAPVISQVTDDYAVNGLPYVAPTITAANAISLGSFTTTSWSLISGPPGMTVNSYTGVLTWPNPTTDGSPYTVTLQATNTAGSGTMSWVNRVVDNPKTIPDGGTVGVDEVPVTVEFGNDVYIEPLSRLWGIKVYTTGGLTGDGTQLRLRGVLRPGADSERYIEVPVANRRSAFYTPAAPFMITLSLLGGGDWNWDPNTGAGQKGVADGRGLNNLGLLVRTCGSVGQMGGDGSYFMLNDGTGRQVKVIAPSTIPTDLGWSYVTVTGISSCELADGQIRPVLRIRNLQDIVPISQ